MRPPVQRTPVPPRVRPTPTPVPHEAGSFRLDAEERAFLNLLNEYRADHGVRELVVDVHLQAASEWMVRDMAARSYVGHTDSLGRRGLERKRAFGYSSGSTGENVAGGNLFKNARNALAAFRMSPAHDNAQLVPSWRAVGIAHVYAPNSRHKHYWVISFGTQIVTLYT